jgi:LacI family transcriptional regulator
LRNGRVDGIMISVSNTTINMDHIDAWRQTGFPLVLFDRTCEDIDVPNIMTNDAEMAYKATEHLLKRGCKHVAYLGMAGNLSISNRRKAGYLAALEKYKVTTPPQIVDLTAKDYINREILHQVFQQQTHPDGVLPVDVSRFTLSPTEP